MVFQHPIQPSFATLPSVPYAWQPAGTTPELPGLPGFYSKRLNVLGFMPHKGEMAIYPAEGNANTEQVVSAFDRFTSSYEAGCHRHQKPCVAILDNASFHASQKLQKHINKWGHGA